ncbi:type II secretion system secretin GspD [Hyphomicrobium sp. MC1]|uniref:type II secretion system secretin GspD n=1 Tax=Hyphomicrobium sp. (strain MC1) TaxID=717785 RepID=UPI00059E0476|nr:type II secretion system secretin GspD [Hyphomicrobium sp. MC1]
MRLTALNRRVLPTISDSRPVHLEYTDADAARVVREVVHDVLDLPVQVDPSVAGRVTLTTSGTIPISEVPKRLDEALRPLGFGIAAVDGVVRAGPLTNLDALGREAQQEMRVIPLSSVPAAEIITAVQSNLPDGVRLQPTPDGRSVIATGPPQAVSNVEELVQLFDSDVLRGRSFGLYPLANATPGEVTKQVEQIFSGVRGVTVMAVQRSNAVLVVTDRPELLRRARYAIEQLDRAPDGLASLQVVPLKYRRATDLADILNQAFGGLGGAPTATPTSSAGAPGAVNIGGNSSSSSSGAAPQIPAMTADNSDGLPDHTSTAATVPPAQQSGAPLWEQMGLTAPVRIQADAGRNALLVAAAPVDLNSIIAAIRRLDQPQRQVFIEAVIAEVSLTDELRYGVDYSIKTGAGGVLSQLAPLLTSGTPMGGLSFLIQNSNVDALVQALSNVTDVRVVSAPRVLVLDNETATLQVGDQVPILTQTQQSTDSTTAPIVNSVQMRDTGVILRVRPRVGADGTVSLDLFQEVSDAVTTDSSSINSPTIQVRRLQSTVAAHSGDTIALGGLMKNRSDRQRSGIPYLSRIPLFGANDQTKTRSELLILLTPRVIDSSPGMQAMVDELRTRIGTLAPDVAHTLTPSSAVLRRQAAAGSYPQLPIK